MQENVEQNSDTQAIIDMSTDEAPVFMVTEDDVNELRNSNEQRLVRIQQASGQQMDPTAIILMTLIDQCFSEGEERNNFLWLLESRIAEALDQFENQQRLYVPNQPSLFD
jgi:hypothetical protein